MDNRNENLKEEIEKLRKQRASWIPGRGSMEDELKLPAWAQKLMELRDEVRRAKQLRKLESGKGKGKDKDAKQAEP